MEKEELCVTWEQLRKWQPRLCYIPPFATPLSWRTLPMACVLTLSDIGNGVQARETIDEIRDSLYRLTVKEEYRRKTPQRKTSPFARIWFLRKVYELLCSLRAPSPAFVDDNSQPLQANLYRSCHIIVLHRREQRTLLEPLLKEYKWLIPVEFEPSVLETAAETKSGSKGLRLILQSDSSNSRNERRSVGRDSGGNAPPKLHHS